MNKIVEAVKEGRKIETKDLISVVNDFCLTRLAVKTSDGEILWRRCYIRELLRM